MRRGVIFALSLTGALSLAGIVHAQGAPELGYKSMAGIPFVNNVQDLPALLNALYKLTIIVGALAAVIQITVAGFQYMGDNLGGKEAARSRISDALFGLLILLTAVLILNTISGPVRLDVLRLTPLDRPQLSPNIQDPSQLLVPPTSQNPAEFQPELLSCGANQFMNQFGECESSNSTPRNVTSPSCRENQFMNASGQCESFPSTNETSNPAPTTPSTQIQTPIAPTQNGAQCGPTETWNGSTCIDSNAPSFIGA